jgi:hypothetical protein
MGNYFTDDDTKLFNKDLGTSPISRKTFMPSLREQIDAYVMK